MNPLAHVFLSFLALSFFIPDIQKYLIPAALFAVVLDFDHVPGYVKLMFLSKKQKSGVKASDYIDMFRTAIQEPVGILTIELAFLILYLFGVRSVYLAIASLSIFLHWLIDFLTVHTRPFDPVDKRVVCLFFNSKKRRVLSEIIITIVSFILFILVYWGHKLSLPV